MTDLKTRIADHLDAAFRSAGGADVVPVILIQVPGCGVVTKTVDYAAARAIPIMEVRCAQLDQTEFLPLPVFANGLTTLRRPSLKAVRDLVTRGSSSIVVLSDAVANGTAVATRMLEQIAQEATAAVVVPIIILNGQLDEALKAIESGLGLLPAEVAVHVVANGKEDVDAFVAYARTQDVDETILSMIEAKGDFLGATPKAWIRYSAFRSSADSSGLDRETRRAFGIGFVGEAGYDALVQWIRGRQSDELPIIDRFRLHDLSTVEGIVDRANEIVGRMGMPRSIRDAGARQGGYAMIDVVDPRSDGVPVASVLAKEMGRMIEDGAFEAWIAGLDDAS